MIKSLAILYLISALIATVEGCSCLYGHARNSDTSEEKSLESIIDSKCIVISEQLYAYGQQFHSIYKSHAGTLPCNTTLYGYTEDAHLIINFQCCSGDDCNTNNYEMPPDDHEPRGKSCPSCIGNTLEECVSKKEIVCKNPEDKCMTYIGSVINPDGCETNYSVKGCASPLACTLGFAGMIGAHQKSCPLFKCD
ncbi:uncharacterized protein O3C94_014894 [Discoglossus pictus]